LIPAGKWLAPATIACYANWIGEFLRGSRLNGRWRAPGEFVATDGSGLASGAPMRARGEDEGGRPPR
jgi:hypothetical protein